MRVALVSDMHGNAVGFDAVIAELERETFDEIVCLGDVAQGGPQPVEVVDRLRELGWRTVFGNSDEFLLTLDLGAEVMDPERLERTLATARWTRGELGDERLEYLRTFEPTVELALEGRRLVCCHATPTSNEDVILPETPREQVAEAIGDADAVACGHVHLQWLRRVGQALWFCAGSAGLVYEQKEPLDEQPFEPWAEYAVLSTGGDSLRVEFRRVAFDVEALVHAIRRSGMPSSELFASEWKSAG
jgi:predicted phosphodiesterase